MNNISFDTTNLSDKLGLYDFFNVLLYGIIFIGGLCAINVKLYEFLWKDITFIKGLGIVLSVYISGLVLQELGTKIDRKWKYLNMYKGMHRSILKSDLDVKCRIYSSQRIIENPIVLERYRQIAKDILPEEFKEDEQCFEKDYINGYIFSVYQYYVAVHGKDKKVEKMRALFSMSKTLMVTFFLLAIVSFISLFFKSNVSIPICDIMGISDRVCVDCINKVIVSLLFFGLGILFYYRAKRTMQNFLLILMGTYDAILRLEEKEKTQNKTKEDSKSEQV